MNMLWRRRLHGGVRGLGWTAGVLVILFAVLAALAQLLLPLLARHPAWVAAQLSQRLQRPVSFESMEGHWTQSGPEFVMHSVTIGPAPGESGTVLRLPESRLRLDLGGWLLPSRHLLNVYVRGLQLDLLHDAAGWHVNGIGVSGGKGMQPPSLGRWSVDLWLDDLRVEVTDATLGKRYTLLARKLRLSHQGDQIRFGGILRRDGVSAASVRAAGRFRQDGRAGQIWFSVDGAELKSLLDGIDVAGYRIDHGAGRLSAWLDWREGKLVSSVVRFSLETLAVSTAAGGSASVASLHGLAGVRHLEDGYELRWAGADGSAAVLDLRRPGTPRFGVDAVAHKLQLAPLLPWLALKPDLAPPLAQWLGSGHPHGELGRVVLHWTRAGGLRELALHFDGLGIDPVDQLPGVRNLHGVLRGDAAAFSLELPEQAATLQFPHVFRQPFVLSKLAGTLAFWSQDGDWHIGADTLDFVGAGYAGSTRGEVVLPAQGGAPTLDLYATVDHADVPAAKLFWPVNVMPPATVAWLDRALVAGHVEQAWVLVHGDLADWPFRHNEGRFEARAQISGLTLDYGSEWPRAEGIDAVASFVNSGMLVQTSAGHALGVNAERAVALIPDFGQGLLDLNVRGSGSGASLLEFARKSPIASHVADTLAKLSLGGHGTFGFHLSLPLAKVEDAELDGSAQLHDVSATAPDWKLDLQKLNGPLRFDLHGLQADSLDTVFHGQPSRLQLAIAGANSDPATVLLANLQGSYQIAELVQGYPSLKWLGELGQGRSAFNIGFTLAHQPGTDVLAQRLSIDSSLEGIALQLPAPLDKPAAGSLPLHLTMSLPIDGSDLQLGLGQVLRGHLRLADGTAQPLAGTLALGDQMPQALPARDLRVRGHAATLDVTGWVRQVAAGAGGAGPGLESLDISTDQAGWFGRPLGPLALRATPQADVLSVDVKGPAMAGNFRVPTRQLDKRGVTARLQLLYWPKDVTVQDAGRTDGKAAVAVDAATPAPDPANTGINPAALPPFHLWIGDLRLGDSRLGEARLETWPTPNGMHIEQLRTLSRQVQITASGDWNGTASDSHTHMRISFSAEDLGAMLSAFGYAGLVQGGKTRDQLDATWPGSPNALSLAAMDGSLSIHVSDGRIPEASGPGVGRLLGLVSLAELPRRLNLDFGDVFGKGLGFDSINGDFRLAHGGATTSNLVIHGAAANITIAGRTGLRARDYDQEIRVIPHVGNSLPLVGAVVGGPIGAAAGFAVQGLLGKGLNKAASARYRITGSWDDPVMTLIEKHEVVIPAQLLPSPAGSASAAAGSSSPPAPAASVVAPAAASSVPR
ncbi:MAG: TIGR02099 family protein [Rhodanobacter sp.]|nr:MAG: TIGR02099 family protein [Rhodanobacter sp.]TAM42666.1 MAG: TIGR02099 family protein [Rhodanobacter sp.]TAN26819.1 MAG: TIGR02099 family protein [Rhodanobacter sp.]